MDTPTVRTPSDIREEEASLIHPSLSLEIDDASLIRLIDKRIKADESYYEGTLKLSNRRKRNEEYYLGKQIDESQIDQSWQIPYVDNILWQDLETRCALATAKIPDIIAIPPQEDAEVKERAKNVEHALDIRLNNDSVKRLLRNGTRDNHLFLIGVIKIRWDESIGENGEFVFEKVNPKRISFDHSATIPEDGYTADNMETIYEWIERPVGMVLTQFPDKKDELKKHLGIITGTYLQLASKMNYLEVHFTYFDKKGDRQEGVCWKYKDLILGKSKTPYYDWEGVEKITSEVDEFGAPVVTKEFKNFFDRPRKPYIFFSYQNLGNSPIDDTSAFEQGIPLQRNVNKRGRQITEIADNAVPKKVFNGNYITKEESRKISQDPGEHVWIEGEGLDDVRKAFATVQSSPPSPILFDDLQSNRSQMDSKFSTHALSRGEMGPQESGIARQIIKSGDTAMMDDMVNMMLVRVVSEMAGWALQMMRVNYDKEHHLRTIGKDGEMVALAMSQDQIDDGIGLKVQSSTTAKDLRRTEAMDLAKTKGIDPLTLYEDIDAPNPKERTQRLIAWNIGIKDGFMSYQKLIGGNQAGPETPAGSGGVQGLTAQQAQQDLQMLQSGQPVEPQGMPTPEYMQVFMQFVDSGQLEQLSPEIQQNFQVFVQKLKALVAQYAQGANVPAAGGEVPPYSPPATGVGTAPSVPA